MLFRDVTSPHVGKIMKESLIRLHENTDNIMSSYNNLFIVDFYNIWYEFARS